MTKAIVWILFFLSGACALVYEVLWMRHLGLILGNTVHSLSAVLSAFMAGLALGSFLAGRYLAKRGNLLLIYGVLEIVIGVYCLLLPLLFEATVPLYALLYDESGAGVTLPIVRFAVCFILLLLPTTCMGATLPILTQYLIRSPQGLSRTAGTLYAINTFGAVFGAASAGFFLLPLLGRSWSNYTAVIANLVLGLLAIVWSRKAAAPVGGVTSEPVETRQEEPSSESKEGSAEDKPPAEVPAFAVRAAAITFGITGFAAMATQIGWTRALSLSLGSSTYAFSLIVAIFILGLAFGGAWGARISPRLKDPVGTLALVLMLIGIITMAVVSLLGFAPIAFFWLIAVGSQWGFGSLMALEALGIGALLIIPTFLMGAIMPITLQVARGRASGAGGAGRTVGSLYAINTLGSILGSLLGGLVFLPLLQIQTTLKLMALLYAFPGAALFRISAGYQRSSRQVLAALLVIAAFMLAFLPSWNPLEMSEGAYLMRHPGARDAARKGDFLDANPFPAHVTALYYREGLSATVSVTQREDRNLTLSIGGKPDASTSEDMSTQVGLGLLPTLLHTKGPKDVLVIGMGSGITLGAALAPESVKRVDVLEISAEVMEASWHFRDHNGLTYADDANLSPIADPRVQVLINDGRNHLRLSTRTYDVITSEPSNPWIAGIGNLFTRESFELCRARLNQGGIMCQWLHRYGLAENEFRSVMATFAEVFPCAQLWCVLPGSDYLLIGSDSPITVKVADLQQRMLAKAVNDHLRSVNFHLAPELLACFVADTRRLRELSRGAPIHTDDNMLLEFAAPRTMYMGSVLFPVADWRVVTDRILDFSDLDRLELRDFLSYLDRAVTGRILYEHRKDNFGNIVTLVEAALDQAPFMLWAVKENERIEDQKRKRKDFIPADPERAVVLLESGKWATMDPELRKKRLAAAHEALARKYIRKGLFEEAETALKHAAKAIPDRYQTILLRVRLSSARGDTEKAIEEVKAINRPDIPITAYAEVVVQCFLDGKRWVAAQSHLDQILSHPKAKTDRATAYLWAQRAEVYLAMGKRNEAFHTMKRAAELAPGRLRVQLARARIMRAFGGLPGYEEAIRALEVCAVLAPNDVDIHLELGDMNLLLADVHEGLKQKQKALECRWRARRAGHASRIIAANDPRTCILTARAFLALGDKTTAQVAAIEARKLGGSDYKLPDEMRKLLEDELKKREEEKKKDQEKEEGGETE